MGTAWVDSLDCVFSLLACLFAGLCSSRGVIICHHWNKVYTIKNCNDLLGDFFFIIIIKFSYFLGGVSFIVVNDHEIEAKLVFFKIWSFNFYATPAYIYFHLISFLLKRCSVGGSRKNWLNRVKGVLLCLWCLSPPAHWPLLLLCVNGFRCYFVKRDVYICLNSDCEAVTSFAFGKNPKQNYWRCE